MPWPPRVMVEIGRLIPRAEAVIHSLATRARRTDVPGQGGRALGPLRNILGRPLPSGARPGGSGRDRGARRVASA